MPVHSAMGALIAILAVFVALIVAPFIFKVGAGTTGFIPAGTAGLI